MAVDLRRYRRRNGEFQFEEAANNSNFSACLVFDFPSEGSDVLDTKDLATIFSRLIFGLMRKIRFRGAE